MLEILNQPVKIVKFRHLDEPYLKNKCIIGTNNYCPRVMVKPINNIEVGDYKKLIEVRLFTENIKHEHEHPYQLDAQSANILTPDKFNLLNESYLSSIKNKKTLYYYVDEKNICNLDGININIIPTDRIVRMINNKKLNIKIEDYGELNKCRLRFQLVLYDSVIKEITKAMSEPVFSDVIENKFHTESENSESKNVVSKKSKHKKIRNKDRCNIPPELQYLVNREKYSKEEYEWRMDILEVPKARNNAYCDSEPIKRTTSEPALDTCLYNKDNIGKRRALSSNNLTNKTYRQN